MSYSLLKMQEMLRNIPMEGVKSVAAGNHGPAHQILGMDEIRRRDLVAKDAQAEAAEAGAQEPPMIDQYMQMADRIGAPQRMPQGMDFPGNNIQPQAPAQIQQSMQPQNMANMMASQESPMLPAEMGYNEGGPVYKSIWNPALEEFVNYIDGVPVPKVDKKIIANEKKPKYTWDPVSKKWLSNQNKVDDYPHNQNIKKSNGQTEYNEGGSVGALEKAKSLSERMNIPLGEAIEYLEDLKNNAKLGYSGEYFSGDFNDSRSALKKYISADEEGSLEAFKNYEDAVRAEAISLGYATPESFPGSSRRQRDNRAAFNKPLPIQELMKFIQDRNEREQGLAELGPEAPIDKTMYSFQSGGRVSGPRPPYVGVENLYTVGAEEEVPKIFNSETGQWEDYRPEEWQRYAQEDEYGYWDFAKDVGTTIFDPSDPLDWGLGALALTGVGAGPKAIKIAAKAPKLIGKGRKLVKQKMPEVYRGLGSLLGGGSRVPKLNQPRLGASLARKKEIARRQEQLGRRAVKAGIPAATIVGANLMEVGEPGKFGIGFPVSEEEAMIALGGTDLASEYAPVYSEPAEEVIRKLLLADDKKNPDIEPDRPDYDAYAYLPTKEEEQSRFDRAMESPWWALMQAGLEAAAGDSPDAIKNIAGGLSEGFKDYQSRLVQRENMKRAEEQQRSTEAFNAARADLARAQAEYYRKGGSSRKEYREFLAKLINSPRYTSSSDEDKEKMIREARKQFDMLMGNSGLLADNVITGNQLGREVFGSGV